jgi:manganese transport protein
MPLPTPAPRQPSLPEVERTIAIPHGKGFWRKLLACSGPGYLVSVGYMDPGNWAAVMPHNLYLHSAIVQTRRWQETAAQKWEAIKFATLDSIIALSLALFINAGILVLAASAFHFSGNREVGEIQDVYKLLSPVLGAPLASTLFGVALLASEQSSTLTSTMAGQIVMEGFLHIRLKPWLRRLLTRLVAIVPALLTIGWLGEGSTSNLLILSQAILSL